ncbi:2-dehydropantoate 2-reductase [Jeotgalibacillus salarius]|uniref:2-dehydropantoate 2-reductase n=1 Tax=Jeotgalibacillus salarius TaxID=546023 RepID=A0A4Y8LD72_9BACL|nr:2-dehydropantoate 2-reductase [Jeotgalibacillus salarius]TFE00242.1 2-dehydropantoate 2-reductase [Jeotgalibacillus salarius]
MISIHIHIIGAGSIGLLFAHQLKQCGHHIHICTRTEQQSDQINLHGVSASGGSNQPVTASVLGREAFTRTDAVIIAVKQYHLAGIIPDLQRIPADVPLIFLQNGMAHVQLFPDLNHNHIFVSTVEHGVKKLTSHSFQHNGIGWWRIAKFRGNDDLVLEIINCNQSNFPIAFDQDYESLLTIKLIKNLMINPLTAIFMVKNGSLAENQYFKDMMKTLYGELSTLFPAAAEKCSFEDILDLCRRTAENESSMLSDINAGRKTEIESMTGYALKVAEEKNYLPVILPFLEKGILAIETGRETD